MDSEYRAVEDYSETNRAEILFEGEPIPHVPYTESSQDDFAWGYNGAGPTNVARSILEHATDAANEDFGVEPMSCQEDFRAQFIDSQDSSGDGWTIHLDEVVDYLHERAEE